MKKFALSVLILNAVSTLAQSTHSVTLNWTPGADGGTITVYRAGAACSTNPTFSAIKSGVTVNSYVDTAVTAGTYCYKVTANLNGAESVPSNTANAPVLPQPASTLTVTVQ
jgi:fibronectin type 3 domain-containing protein